MDEKQLSHLENRLVQIENRLKGVQICQFVLIGWIAVASQYMIKDAYQFLGDFIRFIIVTAVVYRTMKWYQDWKLEKEKTCEE